MKQTVQRFVSIVTIFVLFAGLVGWSGMSQAADRGSRRVIVTLENGAVNEAARHALENKGGKVLKDISLVNGLVVVLPSEAAVSEVRGLKGVVRVEEDAAVFALGKPFGAAQGKPGSGTVTQPSQVLEWGVNRIDADLAWGASRGAGVNVAIIDTGIKKDHKDLIGNLRGGVNFVIQKGAVDPSKWNDDNGHGTHVAGIVAAADNAIGVVGVAPQANLWAVKVLDRRGSGYVSDIISGIEWAMNNGMNVINMSLGTSSDVQALHNAVDAAYNSGILIVAAAGNSGDGNGATNEVLYPAKYSSVIAVGATASDDSMPYWSSQGAEVELSAPGVNVRSTWNDGLYKTISGTSMASPHAAGAAALVFATVPYGAYDANGNGLWDAPEVRTVLRATSDDLGAVRHDNFYGYGLVDAEESVTGVQTNP